ncbi:hypothetical protein SAV31267_028790 [Streptomyces avermitilis]|uniref:Uncharacterized protein n=1 Tax=Streptomyces avermitilis TaxID=33903 RepID=A0A4D4MNU5_STRAX|nr:hypothetical protein SAV31267_028790 [Streptomyces avermitilis]
MAAVVVRGAAHRLAPQPFELGVPGVGAARVVEGDPPGHRVARGALRGGGDQRGDLAQEFGAGGRLPAAAHRQLGPDEQRVRVVRAGAPPLLEPLGPGAREGREAGRVPVAVLPLGGLAGAGEQLGRGLVLAASRRDQRGGEVFVGRVEEHLVVGGQPDREARGVPGHPGRTEDRAQQCHGGSH